MPLSDIGKSARETGARTATSIEEVSMTEGSMPPVERPKRSRREGEQEHLREDGGLARGSMAGAEPTEHLQEDTGLAEDRATEEDKGLIDKAKDKLKGQ